MSTRRADYGVTSGAKGKGMPRGNDSSETMHRLKGFADGDGNALEWLMSRHRQYLRRVIDARIGPSIRQRVDPSDVIQETLVVASKQIDDFITRRPTSFRVWLRGKALQKLVDMRRTHQTLKRSAQRDMRLSDVSSIAIAQRIASDRPSESLLRREAITQVRQAMQHLSEADRDILIMRHAEGLTNAEAAESLSVEPKTASKRHGRALQRLAIQLAKLGFTDV